MNLKEKLLSELEKRPDGMENRDLQSVFGEDYQNLVVIIQELINEKRIHVLQGPDGYVFQLSTTEEIQKQTRLEELGDEDMIVYQCIEASGDQGIWIRDIKVQTSLHASTINRAIEKMVKRKLIKSFKSIASKMKIMYILFDKELPKDITGGPWYVEQEFDLEFISVMSKFVQKVLREDEYGLDTKEILRRVTLSNISNVHILRRTPFTPPLSETDILQLLNKMSFDNLIEEVSDLKGGKVWRLREETTTYDHISSTPCGCCTLFYRCFSNAEVNPNNCPYIDSWYALGEKSLSLVC